MVTTHAVDRFISRFPEKMPEGVPREELGRWVRTLAEQAYAEGSRNTDDTGQTDCKHNGMRFIFQINHGRPYLITILMGHGGSWMKMGSRRRHGHVPRHERERDEEVG